jgi:hypothetical protein
MDPRYQYTLTVEKMTALQQDAAIQRAAAVGRRPRHGWAEVLTRSILAIHSRGLEPVSFGTQRPSSKTGS